MDTPSKEITIPKEQAVFWMDANGRWHNAHGPFENAKIIAYFHSAIRKDADGYHLYQVMEDRVEKVYFPHEDTALFVFDLTLTEPEELVLNTGRRIQLDPETLFIQGDSLYFWLDDERVKFTDRSLTKLAGRLTEKDGNYYIETSKGLIKKIRQTGATPAPE